MLKGTKHKWVEVKLQLIKESWFDKKIKNERWSLKVEILVFKNQRWERLWLDETLWYMAFFLFVITARENFFVALKR